MSTTAGYAAHSPTTPLSRFSLERREPGPRDVDSEILFCGVCHSDLHQVRNEWAGTKYPVLRIRETQEMLDFCGRRDIASDVEIIPIQQINGAYERMLRSDVRYRFVIDMATLEAEA